MLRVWLTAFGLLLSFSGLAAQESTMSLLDNRFRVDPSITQITFVIYRAEESKPVVLVRPDGKKYYAWRSPENVRWYQESSMDIVSIDNPMPGPWQAVGSVTPKNKIKLISHLKLSSEKLPARLYQGESLKFTARLTSDDQPLVLRDFLDRVKLKVTFTKFVEDEDTLAKEARPIAVEIGEFADDGQALDEVAGDGVFTVALPINSAAGKYRVRITSGNGVFLRAEEQEVLVYPSPIETTFIQSREASQPHKVVFSGEQGMVMPGSLAARVEHTDPDKKTVDVQGAADRESNKLELTIPYSEALGNYAWTGEVYATEMGSGRPLVFDLSQHTYSVVDELDIAETRRLQEIERMKQQKLLEEQQLIEMREQQKTQSMIMIAVGNLVVILLALVGWFIARKLKARKKEVPEMQLEIPKK